MKMSHLAALAATVIVFGGSAQASQVSCNNGDTCITETFSGIVTQGSDSNGLFGAQGASLLGDFATATFTYDTTELATDPSYAGTSTERIDVPYSGTQTPPIEETFTINGASYTGSSYIESGLTYALQ